MHGVVSRSTQKSAEESAWHAVDAAGGEDEAEEAAALPSTALEALGGSMRGRRTSLAGDCGRPQVPGEAGDVTPGLGPRGAGGDGSLRGHTPPLMTATPIGGAGMSPEVHRLALQIDGLQRLLAVQGEALSQQQGLLARLSAENAAFQRRNDANMAKLVKRLIRHN